MPILLSLLVAEGAESVYDISLVSELCVEIVAEQNTEHTKEFVSLLQAVVKEDTEEIRIRMAVPAKQYSDAISESKAAD
jgi:hypothetical protein